jgi:hypothetical protein
VILIYEGNYGARLSLDMEGELEGFQFVSPAVEFRLARDGSPLGEWQECDTEYHTLQRPCLGGTCGLTAKGLAMEIRGLCGRFILLVWRREGTFR